jgi:hypothetical protein
MSETLTSGYLGLAVLFRLNSDRLLYLATVALALGAGAALGRLLTG